MPRSGIASPPALAGCEAPLGAFNLGKTCAKQA